MSIESTPAINQLLRLAKLPVDNPRFAVRVALLADTSSQILAGALRGIAYMHGFELEIFEAEFDQIDIQVLNPHSDLHRFAPEIAIIYQSSERLADKFSSMTDHERSVLASAHLEQVRDLHSLLSAKGYETICFNLSDPGDGVFGHYGNKIRNSLTFQIRSINFELMLLAEASDDFHLYDLARLQSDLGRSGLTDPKLYWSAKISLTPDASGLVARDLVQMLAVRKGGGHKCIILDLDNTLWGGVIGDDGLERIQIGQLGVGPAFSHFQGWLRQLKERGVVLAVCSKNDESTAREPFVNHPDMVLRQDDIAVFVANWQDKATNIRTIKEIVGVDYGAMVFLDDNPAERELVRRSFPGMTVPELPPDPCEYVPFIQSLNLFETTSYTDLDRQRTHVYQLESQRRCEREKFVDEEDFLASLRMTASVQPFTPFNFPRIAQLTQRSNQFHLRTVRYTEKEIAQLAKSRRHRTLCLELSDKFGDYGLVCVIILERQDDRYFVDTWLMSCRVLGRGLEKYALNHIATAAQTDGVSQIVGEYLPTAKNNMVAQHYERLRFSREQENRWLLDVSQYERFETQISNEGQ